jgi:hypothetical protein
MFLRNIGYYTTPSADTEDRSLKSVTLSYFSSFRIWRLRNWAFDVTSHLLSCIANVGLQAPNFKQESRNVTLLRYYVVIASRRNRLAIVFESQYSYCPYT